MTKRVNKTNKNRKKALRPQKKIKIEKRPYGHKKEIKIKKYLKKLDVERCSVYILALSIKDRFFIKKMNKNRPFNSYIDIDT